MTDMTEDDQILAAEYALRLLDGDAERAAAARALADRDFAAEVQYWQSRLATLSDSVEEVAPSPTAERALMSRLFGDTAPTSGFALWFWKGLAGLTSVAAIAFAALFFVPSSLQDQPLFVAEVTSDDGGLRMLAVVDPTAHTVRLTRTAGAPVDGRVLELWGIPTDGTGPVSLGVLPDEETTLVLVPEALFGKAVGLTLALSDEPPGGSPTGAPTGDVLAVGQLSPI